MAALTSLSQQLQKVKVVQDTEDNPLYEMTLSTAEMNLYLAEFKLLGANLPHTAAELFQTWR